MGQAHIDAKSETTISCILPTYQRYSDLEIVLRSLATQDFQKNQFEVIVVEDGQDNMTKTLMVTFLPLLNLVHVTNPEPINNVARLRNQGLEHSKGRLVLFLDDDTILPQEDFLTKLVRMFEDNPATGNVQIPGEASYGLLRIKYDYLDKYSYASRCVAYRRGALIAIGGFFEELSSYEDIDLAIRYTIFDGRTQRAEGLLYRHPPLYFENWQKPLCNALSFLRLSLRYSWPIWFVCYMNALRFLPLLLSPHVKQRQWGRISAGFFLAPAYLIYRKFVKSDKATIYR